MNKVFHLGHVPGAPVAGTAGLILKVVYEMDYFTHSDRFILSPRNKI